MRLRTPSPRRTTAALASLVLAGCASYQPRPLEPAASEERYLARTLLDERIVRFAREELGLEYPPARWNLATLWAAALCCDPALERARAEEAQSRAAQRTASQRDNPELTLQPERAANPAAGANPWVLGLQGWLPLPTGARRERKEQLAAAELAEARLAPLAAAWQARLRVRSALVDALAGESARELAARRLALAESELALARGRFEAGAISRLELAAVEDQQQREARAAELGARAGAEQRARLAAAVGVGGAAFAEVALDADELAHLGALPEERDALATGLQTRSDLLRALAAYEVAERALALEVERARPDLRLGPGLQFDQGTTKWQLGFALELPVFHQHQGEIGEAEARRTAAAAAFEELQAHVIGEIQVARAQFARRAGELAAAREALGRAAQRASRAAQLFDAGESDRLEPLLARRAALEAEQNLLEARVRAQEAQTALEQALERPLEPVAAEAQP